MGQKVNSIGFRLRHGRKWDSKWFSEKRYSSLLYKDFMTTDYLTQMFEKKKMFTSRCIIKRSLDTTYIFLHIYASEGYSQAKDTEVENLKRNLRTINNGEVILNIVNTYSTSKKLRQCVNKVSTQLPMFQKQVYFIEALDLIGTATAVQSAPLLSRYLAQQLEVNFRHSQCIDFIKKAIPKFMAVRPNLLGIRVQWKGRLSGADRSKKEVFQQGQIPLHTMNAKIDYSYRPAFTIYGTCGIKVWLCLK
jgi:small subunit ribosomal protein S3|tara:strand:+ start:1370 stop:2113 length:744 start_codon:yes stop_codon:yes gene_type:complete